MLQFATERAPLTTAVKFQLSPRLITKDCGSMVTDKAGCVEVVLCVELVV